LARFPFDPSPPLFSMYVYDYSINRGGSKCSISSIFSMGLKQLGYIDYNENKSRIDVLSYLSSHGSITL
jgi:hypothetical protein